MRQNQLNNKPGHEIPGLVICRKTATFQGKLEAATPKNRNPELQRIMAEKQPNRKSKSSAAEPGKNSRFQWWHLVLAGVLVPIIVALIPHLKNVFKPSAPKFGIINTITRPDSAIRIIPRNNAAKQEKPLDVEFDGLPFIEAGRYVAGKKPSWEFSPRNHSLPDSMFRDGKHEIRVGFAGELSEPLMVFFNSRPPVVEGAILPSPGNPDERIVAGRVASTLQLPAETLAVDIFFHHEGQPYRIPVPVRQIVNDTSGLIYFEFETSIQSLPKISPDDPRYTQPFFALKVTDPAGNQYYKDETYAKFIAPGPSRFGVNQIADIELEQLPPDMQKQSKIAIRMVIPGPGSRPVTRLGDGSPAIVLTVKTVAVNLIELNWKTHLPPELQAEHPLTVIRRDGNQIAVSFGNRYTDQNPPKEGELSYQVEQTGKDNRVYGSNIARAKPQDEPEKAPLPPPGDQTYLSEAAVKAMLLEKGFYDRGWNSSGKGFNNDYVLQKNGQVVYDRASGLMWQQSGSANYMGYEEAPKYIERLNANRFAGFSDWRLPTLEEAMTLMEPQASEGLYIDPAFDRIQTWIWTADKYSASSAWVADFVGGYCSHLDVAYDSSVFEAFVLDIDDSII